ncbi:hypothetical protein pb186bvf_018546 [Paramecium bursaria]
MYNQLQSLKITLQFINFKYAILYVGLIIIIIFGMLELRQQSKFDPIGQNLNHQPIMQMSLQVKCDQDYETISYNIQSTVVGCYCQGNKRYSCTELQIQKQGCIPIQSSTGKSLPQFPVLPKSKQYRGIQICIKRYKGLNQLQQIERNNILQPKDCTGDYKICGNETAFFCIHINESSCPIGNFIFSNTALGISNFNQVSNISTYFLYVENNQTQYLADIQLIDGQGVCQDRNQISLSENKSSYELDFIPATNCTLDETYQKFTEINYQIFQEVNNFSFSQYFRQTRPFDDEEQSNIKMVRQQISYVSVQCRLEIHNYLNNKDSIILKFNILLYSQLIVLFLPLIQLLKNKQIRFIYVLVTYALVLGIGTWQVYSFYDYSRILNSISQSCLFKNQEDVINQSIVYQLLLIALVLIILTPTYQIFKILQEKQELNQVTTQRKILELQLQLQLEGQVQTQTENRIKNENQEQVIEGIANNSQQPVTGYKVFHTSQESQTFRGAQSNEAQST